MKKASEFLQEVRQEMKKVVWPSRQEAIKYTWMVIGISLVTAFFLGVADGVFDYLLKIFLIK